MPGSHHIVLAIIFIKGQFIPADREKRVLIDLSASLVLPYQQYPLPSLRRVTAAPVVREESRLIRD